MNANTCRRPFQQCKLKSLVLTLNHYNLPGRNCSWYSVAFVYIILDYRLPRPRGGVQLQLEIACTYWQIYCKERKHRNFTTFNKLWFHRGLACKPYIFLTLLLTFVKRYTETGFKAFGRFASYTETGFKAFGRFASYTEKGVKAFGRFASNTETWFKTFGRFASYTDTGF